MIVFPYDNSLYPVAHLVSSGKLIWLMKHHLCIVDLLLSRLWCAAMAVLQPKAEPMAVDNEGGLRDDSQESQDSIIGEDAEVGAFKMRLVILGLIAGPVILYSRVVVWIMKGGYSKWEMSMPGSKCSGCGVDTLQLHRNKGCLWEATAFFGESGYWENPLSELGVHFARFDFGNRFGYGPTKG